MIGLLVKDLLLLKSYRKTLLITMFLYIVIMLSNTDNYVVGGAGTILIMFLFSIYSISTFSYDERNNTDKYLLTMPVTRKNIVLFKYILGILSIIIGAIFGTIATIIISKYIINIDINFIEYFYTLLISTLFLGLIQSIQIPSIYKFGSEKGKLQIYLIVMFIIVIIGGLSLLGIDINLDFLDNDILLIIIGLFIIFLEYFISYLISLKIYLKKDL